MIGLLSILLEIIFNNIFKSSSLFLPLFTIISIMFLQTNTMYLIKVSLLGLLYDLFFTDYYILHIFIFFILGLIVLLFYKKFKFNIINNIILGLFLLIMYQFALFLIFNIIKVNIINFNEFLYIIKHFLIINLIYVFIVTLLYKLKEKMIN